MQKVKLFFLIAFLSILSTIAVAQMPIAVQTGGDSSRNVNILNTRHLTIQKINDSTTLQILAGAVKLKQGTTLFQCDSCVINDNNNTFEAWGRVYINDADTATITAGHLRYFTQKKLAYLDRGVKLSDGKGALSTPDLEYDLNTDIGIYKNGGTVINKKTVLTSKEGYYYAGLREVIFKKKVDLKDPAYSIKTDSLIYNTETQTTRFIAHTIIKDSSGLIIETKDGFYNVATGKAEFGQRATIIEKNGGSIVADNMSRDEKTKMFNASGNVIIKDTANGITITSDKFARNDSSKITQAQGNVVIRNTKDGTTIIAGNVFRDEEKERTLATLHPLMIVKQDADSIYVTADTLFTARLSDLYGIKDTVVKEKVKGTKVVATNTKDSTNRYFEAYRNVRVFNDSMQAICDSMFYSFKDSTFRLYQHPVVWSQRSQILGDTLLVYTKNKKADRAKVFENSFLINEVEPGVYNQVKSSRMDAYFTQGSIDSVRAAGFAECIYFIQNEDSSYTGINESKCDIMDIYFGKEELRKVVFRSQVTGTIWPIRQKSPDEMRLPNFQWLEAKRPKTKYELY
jgi:lipopolysaccharide export system protein LptA